MRTLFFLVLFLLLGLPALAQSTPPAAADDVPEEIEEVQEVKSAKLPPDSVQILGRIHPALVHFPIGWLTLTLLFELGLLVLGRESLRTASRLALGASALSFLPAAAAGFLRAHELTAGGALPALMGWHRHLALAAAVACWVALAYRLSPKGARGPRSPWGKAIYLALLCGAVVALSLAGHLGARMVFGPDYLPF